MAMNEAFGYPPPPVPGDNSGVQPPAPTPNQPSSPLLDEAFAIGANPQPANVAPLTSIDSIGPTLDFGQHDEVILIGHAHHGDGDWWL
jgi:hypothetical protein